METGRDRGAQSPSVMQTGTREKSGTLEVACRTELFGKSGLQGRGWPCSTLCRDRLVTRALSALTPTGHGDSALHP